MSQDVAKCCKMLHIDCLVTPPPGSGVKTLPGSKSQKESPGESLRGLGRPPEKSLHTVKCGNRLRVGVRSKSASMSRFACRPFQQISRHFATKSDTLVVILNSVQTRCIVKGEAQKSPVFWRFSGGLCFSQGRLFSRNSTRTPPP